jgi:hypothetical protein
MLSAFIKRMQQGMPESKRFALSTFACYSHFASVIVLQILDIIRKNPAVSVQDSLAAAFDPSNTDAQRNEGQASQLHHHQ